MKKLFILASFILIGCETPTPRYPINWNIERPIVCGEIHNQYIDIEVTRWMKSGYETDINIGDLYRGLIVKYWMRKDVLAPFDRWCRDNLTREQYYCTIYTNTFEEMNSCFPVRWK